MTTGDTVEPMETDMQKDPTDSSTTVEGENGDDDDIENGEETAEFKSHATFRFEVNQISKMKLGASLLSPPCTVRGLPWKIMVQCRDQPRGQKSLAYFLQCNADYDASSWSCYAVATLCMLSQKDGVPNYERKTSHLFSPKENDWGFTGFFQWEALLNPEKGFVKDDTIILEVKVEADAPHGVQWDSKKHTGYVGLKNQGATCYMNSLLQTLFFTNKLRKAVYQMPTDNDDPQKSVAMAMQNIFYELQFSNGPVGTKKLTRSFGWETMDSFLQHDVQELNRVLLDNIESKMKGTPVEGTIPKLFEGKMKSYVRCKSVQFESNREEAFYDIQLNVKGQKDIYDSFKDYIAVETLEGDNKFDAGEFGMQEAEKGVIFQKFPPVLHLQLMRFTYDPMRDQNVKINDRFEFPEKLKLDKYLETAESSPAEYTLHAVLVHSGDFHSGHYVVCVNPKGNGKWCKFDDDVVSNCTKQQAIEANFGGTDEEFLARYCTSAYMLVYIRDSLLNHILQPVLDADIPASLKQRVQEERDEEALKKKEKNEAHLYATIVLVTEDCFEGYQGFDLLDLDDDHKLCRKLRVRKTCTIGELYQILGQQLNLKPFKQFRLWWFRQIQSGSVRPIWLDPSRLRAMVDPLMYFFLEIVDFSIGEKELPQFDAEKDTIVFLKYYAPETSKIIYCGYAIAPGTTTPEQLKPELRRRVALPDDIKLLAFVENSPSKITHIDSCDMTLDELLGEFAEQTILVFQLVPPLGPTGYELPTVKEYFRELLNRVEVEITDKTQPNITEPVVIVASMRWKYQKFSEEVGKRLNCDPYKILFHRPHSNKEGCVGSVIKWQPEITVKEMLRTSSRRNQGHQAKLYFEKVPIGVDELEHKHQVDVEWMDSRMKCDKLIVYPNKGGTVNSILDEVRKQVQLAEGGSGKLRLLIISNDRIMNVVPNEQSLESLIDNLQRQHQIEQYRVEEIPLDQLNIDSKSEYLLPVAHFQKDQAQSFGTPFLLKVRHGETFLSVKNRVQELLEVSDKDVEKYKFALCTVTKCSYLEMDTFTINLNDLCRLHMPMPSRPWLGLEHVNKNPKNRGSLSLEKAIVIRN